MARFRVEIFKRIGTERWENRYYIETLSFTTAMPLAVQVANAERSFHSDQVQFEYIRVSTAVEGDNLFMNQPYNLAGQLAPSSVGGLLPLWNVLKVYLSKDLARPDYKLYRGCLGENNTESGTVIGNMRDIVADALSPLVSGDPQIIFPESGPGYTNVDTDPLIRQRDLHRRKRRSTSSPLQQPG